MGIIILPSLTYYCLVHASHVVTLLSFEVFEYTWCLPCLAMKHRKRSGPTPYLVKKRRLPEVSSDFINNINAIASSS